MNSSYGYTFDDRINWMPANPSKGSTLYIEETTGRTGTTYAIRPIRPNSRLGQWLHDRSSLFNWIYTAIAKIGIARRGNPVHYLELKAGGPGGHEPSSESFKVRIIEELDGQHPIIPRIAISLLNWDFGYSQSVPAAAALTQYLESHPNTLQQDALDRICRHLRAINPYRTTTAEWTRLLEQVGREISAHHPENSDLQNAWCEASLAFEEHGVRAPELEALRSRWLSPSNMFYLSRACRQLNERTSSPEQALETIEQYLTDHIDQLENNLEQMEPLVSAVLGCSYASSPRQLAILAILSSEERSTEFQRTFRDRVVRTEAPHDASIEVRAVYARICISQRSLPNDTNQRTAVLRVLRERPDLLDDEALRTVFSMREHGRIMSDLTEAVITLAEQRPALRSEFVRYVCSSWVPINATAWNHTPEPAVLALLLQDLDSSSAYWQQALIESIRQSREADQTALYFTQLSDLIGLQGSSVNELSINTAITLLGSDIRHSPEPAYWTDLLRRICTGIERASNYAEQAALLEALVGALERNREGLLTRRVEMLFHITDETIRANRCEGALATRVQSLRAAALPAVLRNPAALAQFPEDEREELIRQSYWSNVANHFVAQGARYRIGIRQADLRQDPERVLQAFYQHCYMRDAGIEGIRVNFLNSTLEDGPGYDAGGLRREFVSTLFSSLAEKASQTEGGLGLISFDCGSAGILPKQGTQTQVQRYRRAIARVFSDEEVLEAAIFTYGIPEDAPAAMRSDDGSWNIAGIREHWEVLTAALPVLSHEELQVYEAIGKLMGLCYRSEGELLVGEIFDPRLFAIIAAIEPANLGRTFDRLSHTQLLAMYEQALTPEDELAHRRIAYHRGTREIDPEVLRSAYDDWTDWPEALRQGYDVDDFEEPPLPNMDAIQPYLRDIRAALAERLLANARKASGVAPAFAIAKGLAHNVSGNQRMDAQTMARQIQGVFSKDRVIAAIQQSGTENVRGHLTQWIRESTDDQVKLFVKAVTGSESLAAGSRLDISTRNSYGETRAMSFATCFNQLTCAQNYSTYDRFKQTLELSIANAMNNPETMQRG